MNICCVGKNIIFEITNICNFKCEYCFENGWQTFERKIIDFEIIKKAIDRYLVDAHTSYMITFFGGEPLLGFSVIKQAVYYANEKARQISSYVSYNIVTNGSLLDKKIADFLCAHNFYVFFSYDGNEFCQNKYRKLDNGTDSNNIVESNLCNIIRTFDKANLADHLIVRMTITGDTVESLTERYRRLVELGCEKVTFALVSSCATTGYAITESVLDVIREEYKKLADIYINEIASGVSHNRFFQSILYKIGKGYSKKFFCDCGKAYIGIGVKGEIYPCEGFFGNAQFCIGNINDSVSAEYSCGFRAESVEENSTCQKCWAKYLCGGGCYQENYLRTSSVNCKSEIMCETYRIAAETALSTYYKLKDSDLLDSFMILAEEKIDKNAIPHIDIENVKLVDDYLFISQIDAFAHIEMDSLSRQILMLCDGKNTVHKIVDILVSEFDASEDVIYADVSELINHFMECQAVFLTV